MLSPHKPSSLKLGPAKSPARAQRPARRGACGLELDISTTYYGHDGRPGIMQATYVTKAHKMTMHHQLLCHINESIIFRDMTPKRQVSCITLHRVCAFPSAVARRVDCKAAVNVALTKSRAPPRRPSGIAVWQPHGRSAQHDTGAVLGAGLYTDITAFYGLLMTFDLCIR